jgi:hypothetical protein
MALAVGYLAGRSCTKIPTLLPRSAKRRSARIQRLLLLALSCGTRLRQKSLVLGQPHQATSPRAFLRAVASSARSWSKKPFADAHVTKNRKTGTSLSG